ncbi:YceI family protein [Streptomyces sp. NPDC007984]|uniref:YceI family protein n=1 Tax=Streptomyces sp. NPDC007984 TaxID=3364801 RepID=UPI0036E20A85
MSLDPTTRPPTAPAGTWRLEPDGSTVEFTGRHFFLLPVHGSLPVRSGRVEIAPDGRLVRLDAAVAAAGFETGNPGRDTAVRGPRFLDAEHHPELRLTGETLADDLSLTARLEVKGRATPVTFTVDELTEQGERVVVRATARVDRHSCGVGGMRGLVGAELLVRVRAVFAREG